MDTQLSRVQGGNGPETSVVDLKPLWAEKSASGWIVGQGYGYVSTWKCQFFVLRVSGMEKTSVSEQGRATS